MVLNLLGKMLTEFNLAIVNKQYKSLPRQELILDIGELIKNITYCQHLLTSSNYDKF